MTPSEQVKEKLAHLQNALLTKTPQLPLLLRDIHSALKKDPEVVTLLSPQDISIFIEGLKKQTGIHLASTLTSPASKKKTSQDANDY